MMYRLIYRNFATCSTAVEPYRAGEKALPLGATATTAASGGNREELLGQRPAGCKRQRSRRWVPQPDLGASAPERARTLAEKRRRGDSIALTKRQLIAARRLLGDGLALSVIASQCHLSQRERLWPTGRRKKPPGPALRGEKLSFRKRVCKAEPNHCFHS